MNSYDKAHEKAIRSYIKRIRAIMDKYTEEYCKHANSAEFDADKPFSFDDYPATLSKVKSLEAKMAKELQVSVEDGVADSWAMSNRKNDALVKSSLSAMALEGMGADMVRRYFNENRGALDAFKQRVVNGMNLSQRVWKITEQNMQEMEGAIDIALRDGTSAAQLSRKVRGLLNEPDKLFRRVRDEHGVLHLSKNAKAYHPGQGVYRSSYKNAIRLAGTEINMAYRTADHLRYQQLDFVVGIEILTSPTNHPDPDICDELKGKYPKDFKFTGWHPNCRCHVETILKTEQEMDADDAAIRSGGRPSTGSVNTVKDMPDQFERWLRDNEERIARANSLPYFLRDNYTITPGADGSLTFERIVSLSPAVPAAKSLLDIAAERHAARTPQQVDAIKARVAARQEAAKAYDDIMAEYGHLASEIDFTQSAFTADYKAWKKEVDALRTQIDARFAAFGYIKDAKALSHTYTLAELEAADTAINSTLKRIGYDTMPTDKKVANMAFERDYIDKHRKYSTWEVVRDTYERLRKENEAILIIENMRSKYSELKKFALSHKSKDLKELVSKLNTELLLPNPDLSKIDSIIDEAEKKRHILELREANRARKRAAKSGTTPIDHNSIPTLTQLQATIENYKKNNHHYGQDARNYQSEGKEVMKRLFDKHSFGMNIKDSLLEKVYNSHFKNTFETGSSGGYKGSTKTTGKIETGHARLRAAHHMFMNNQPVTSQLERYQYEKYGSLLDSNIEKSLNSYNPARQYGNVEIRFKKDKVVCTWTANDSLCEYYQPSLVSDPDMASFDNLSVPKDRNMIIGDMEDFRNQYTRGSYLELQYHGDVTVDCIESIAFPYDITKGSYSSMIPIATKFNARGINIFYMDNGKLKQFGTKF